MAKIYCLLGIAALLGACRITTQVEGEGLVASVGGNFYCSHKGGKCSKDYDGADSEIFVAVPANPDFTFSKWTNCDYLSLNRCEISFGQDAAELGFEWTIKAEFKPVENPVLAASYSYNALGQRITRTVAGTTTVFQYDLDGNLIAELDSSGMPLVQHVYINAQPLAQITTDSSSEGVAVFYVHTDHLGSPSLLTDQSGTVVADMEATPFGESYIAYAEVEQNRRFPGQYYDLETGLHYNYFRDYDPHTGRYIQSDPIGLEGGINSFEYAAANPVNLTDRFGLDPFLVSRRLSFTPRVSHNFIVHSADYIGDPGAIIESYGQNNEGNTGRVDLSTRGFSADTYLADRDFWNSLAEEDYCKTVDPSVTPIPASDSDVIRSASTLIENTDYAAFAGPFGTNSNSAASAVANRAARKKVAIPSTGRFSPGVRNAHRIQFR